MCWNKTTSKSKTNFTLWMFYCFRFWCFLCDYLSIYFKEILSLFTSEAIVIMYGSQYLKGYVLDCMFASIHFCFSGFFTAYGYSMISFIHNVISIVLIRVPGAYITSKLFLILCFLWVLHQH